MPLVVDARTQWGRPIASYLVREKHKCFLILTFSWFLDQDSFCFPIWFMQCPLLWKLLVPLCRCIWHTNRSFCFFRNAISCKVTTCHYCHDIWVGELRLVLLLIWDPCWKLSGKER